MFKSFPLARTDYWFVLVSLLAVSFPWSERINAAIVLLLFVFWLADKKLFSKLSLLKGQWKLVLPFWTLVLLHIIFLPASDQWSDAWQSIEVKLTFIVLPLIFSTENHLNKKNKTVLFALFCLSCLLSALYCIVAYRINFYPAFKWSMLFDRMYFSIAMMHPGYYSNFFLMAVICLSLYLKDGKELRIRYKVIASLLVLFFLVILFILVSKTALILLMLYGSWFVWKLLRNLKQTAVKYILFAGILVIAIIAFTAVPNIQKRIVETRHNFSTLDSSITFDNSTGSRIVAWKLEWQLIRARWLTGYGTGNANELLLNQFKEGHYNDLVKNQMHTHNQILHLWLDLGVAGVLSLVWIIIVSLRQFYLSGNELGTWSVWLLLICCLTDDALEIQSITVFCIFLISLLLFKKHKPDTINQAESSDLTARILS
jgi:O-antigen ligase